MNQEGKSKQELLEEINRLRRRVSELERQNTLPLSTEPVSQKREEQLRLALEAMQDGFWDWDLTTGEMRYSPQWAVMLGYAPEELDPHAVAWEDLVHPDDLKEVKEKLEEYLTGRLPHYEVEYQLRTKSGQWNWTLARGKVVARDEEGQPVRMAGACTDISERKWVEEALQHRNCELALLNHATQAFNSSLDLDQVLVRVLEGVRYLLNVSGCSVWLIDPETGDLVCRQASGRESDAVRGWRLASGQGIAGWVVQHGQSLMVKDTRIDERHFKAVDQKIGVEHRSILSIPLWAKENVIGALHVLDAEPDRFSTMDLTLVESLAATAAIAIENARLFEQARHDAETKSMLLHEVNHRVKNNLSAIIGLLYVEQRHASLKNGLALPDLVSRIQGMATVHRLLSASEWAPVLLAELASQIVYSALQVVKPDKRVVVNVCPSMIRVSPRQASSLALILNELATNSLKYGLAERKRAAITVHIDNEDEIVLLKFSDDGVGYPEETLSLENHNVGLYLIKALVNNELRGELDLSNDHGAVTAIRFKAS